MIRRNPARCRATRLLPMLLVLSATAAVADYFTVAVVDDQSGRGVPLVELRTVNSIRYYTDSAGVIVIDDPSLMDREVFFHVSSHGYEYPADGFGYRGVRLTPKPGGVAEVRIHRVNIADRLYRVTGGGIYRDSVLAGRAVPLAKPVLNGQVFGQDSVLSVVYQGKVYWFWGDTSRPAYPLGNFETAGATSLLPGLGGLAPETGVDLTYFVDDKGFTKRMAPTPGRGPTWIDGLVTLSDNDGREHLYATFAKVRQDMSAQARGLLEFDDAAEQFNVIASFDIQAPIIPGGHPFVHTVAGAKYVYYTRPFPVVRVRATIEQMTDLSNYECFTCLRPGCTADEPELERDASGAVVWAWKKDAPPLLPTKQEALVQNGTLPPADALFRLHDVATGKPVIVHGGSVYWNAYRQRWVMIALEAFGTSFLGEIWLAEAETPLGPWCFATKIVTHEKYSFYNPKQHPMFDQEGGRLIYFEGTYTHTFSGNPDQTPRYDYNQIMYRLDLDDPRTALPQPFYRVAAGPHAGRLSLQRGTTDDGTLQAPEFYALDRFIPGSIAIHEAVGNDDVTHLQAKPAGEPEHSPAGAAVFYALPADASDPPATTAILYEVPAAAGRPTYIVHPDRTPPASQPHGATALCRIWCDPRRIPPRSQPTDQSPPSP